MNLIILDNSIVDYTTVIESLNINTKYIILNRFADTYDTLKTKIAHIGVTAFESVGILQHNTNEPTYCLFTNIVIAEPVDKTQTSAEPRSSLRELAEFQLGGNDDIPTLIRDPIPKSILLNVSEKDPALETWTEYINFISFLKNTYHIQNLDLMACAIYSNKDWVYVIEALQLKTCLNIRASLDNTGSQNLGGNWFLETGGINLETTYFTENINKFNGLLNVITGFTGSFDPSSWVQTTTGSTTGSSVSISSETMSLVSPNSGSGSGSVDVAITLSSDGTISFSYSATTVETGLHYDPVGWRKNGETLDIFNSGNNITGTRSFSLLGTDKFSFFTSSTDNVAGSSTLTISNFTFTPTTITITPTLGDFNMTRTFGDSTFTINQPTSNSPGAFTYSVISGTDVISISGTTITIARVGTATVQAYQAASGNYLAATKNATITISQATPSLTVSKNKYNTKYILNGTVNFDVFSTNAESGYTRQFSSNNDGVITLANSSSPNVTITGPGRTTVNVTQNTTTNFTAVTVYNIIQFVIVGQNQTYTSDDMTSLDLSGTNLSGSIFNSCNLTGADLYNTIVNTTTNFSTSTLALIKSGRITGTTFLLPAGYAMI